LVYGEYELTCQVAAWQGTPYLKCEIFDPTGAIVASTIVAAKPDINRSRAAISGATKVNLSFYSMLKGNYKVRFSPVNDAQGNGGTWREVVIGNVGLYYKGNPLAFKSAIRCLPDGRWWMLATPLLLELHDGPRTMTLRVVVTLLPGFYVRQSDATKSGYAEYGTAQGYGMSLKAGSYNLSYNAVAWSGTPYLKCEVFDRNNNSLGVQIHTLQQEREQESVCIDIWQHAGCGEFLCALYRLLSFPLDSRCRPVWQCRHLARSGIWSHQDSAGHSQRQIIQPLW
jgi:roadblock/LC7 domain-containing protein